MKKILFVCSGNTCRSPMAAGLARQILNEAGSGIEVASAGLSVWPESSASPEALQVMKEEGIDLSRHRTRQLSAQEVAEAGLILTMTAAQKRRLLSDYPAARGKVYQLKEYAAGTEQEGVAGDGHLPELSAYDVNDPFGGTVENYRACAAELRQALEALTRRLAREQGMQDYGQNGRQE